MTSKPITRLIAVVLCAAMIAACSTGDEVTANEATTTAVAESETSEPTTEPVADSGSPSPLETSDPDVVSITGELPELTDPDPALGTPAPSFVAQTFGGETISFDSADGTPRLYVFFTHWCPSCQAEITEMTHWINDNGIPDGVEVVAISTAVNDTRDNYPPSEWFDREAWPTTVVADDALSSIASGFSLPAFPYSVAVGSDGQVIARTPGRVNEAAFVMTLDTLAAS